MAIPEPSEQDWGEKDSESFLTDPEELWDRLPQPYRMIDKVLDILLGTAWESILKRETARSASQKKHPNLMLSADTELPECTSCLACSGDGRYLAVGHSQGVSVSCAVSLACVSSWLEDGLDITAIRMTGVGQEAYLISTVDDMGVARVFALSAEKIYLLKIVNKTEDINQRNVCVTFDLSEGGDFGAVLMSCNGAFWLDIYNFPLKSWLADLKQAAPQSQKPTVGDVNWTHCSVLMKITSGKLPTGKTLQNPAELLKKAEQVGGMGSGQNHMIGVHQWKDQDAAFRSKYGSNSDHVGTQPRLGSMHFLQLCGVAGGSGAEATTTQTGEVPESICLWWTGSHNLLQYSLCKAKDKHDVDPRPAMLWPNAQEIVCSAVSQSTRFIALGLEPDLVSVWDRQTGSPLSVVVVSAADSVLTRVMFVEGGIPAAFSRRVHLVVSCRSGTTLTLTAGASAAVSGAETLGARPGEAGRRPSAITSVAFLLGLTLVLQRNGELLILDAINKATVCCLMAPATHLLACPLDPVFTLDTVRQILFMRGDQLTSQRSEVPERIQSHLLVFRFGDHALFKPHMVAPGGSVQPVTMITLDTLEQACNRYLQHRSLIAGQESHKAVSITCMQTQENVHKVRKRTSLNSQ
ncbi:WD repeat-containing protein 93 isoform X1 [Gadus morhua]|uniref:WD repeat-containing protein 93 n=1 Tax=Gadus morhua TaxID=8049 RepID=A0A8C5A347_GADMO|nr:WD repeat-containing protein 93 isoform X1 [Gadus morhua]